MTFPSFAFSGLPLDPIYKASLPARLPVAELKGKIAHDFRVFFMGHRGSMESKYTTNKGVLPEALLQEMQESFARSEEFSDLKKHGCGQGPHTGAERGDAPHNTQGNARAAGPDDRNAPCRALATWQV